TVPDGQELIAATDTIVAGVHFLDDDPPDSIGHKALAVTLSELAAKGARGYAYLLNLSLPEPTAAWLDGFASGLRALQATAGARPRGGGATALARPPSTSTTARGPRPPRQVVSPCR